MARPSRCTSPRRIGCVARPLAPLLRLHAANTWQRLLAAVAEGGRPRERSCPKAGARICEQSPKLRPPRTNTVRNSRALRAAQHAPRSYTTPSSTLHDVHFVASAPPEKTSDATAGAEAVSLTCQPAPSSSGSYAGRASCISPHRCHGVAWQSSAQFGVSATAITRAATEIPSSHVVKALGRDVLRVVSQDRPEEDEGCGERGQHDEHLHRR